MRLIKVLGLEAMLLAVSGGIYMREYEPSWMEINEVTLRLPRLEKPFSGLRMVQISDLHVGGWMTLESLADIVQMVVDQSPDLVVLTGDYVAAHGRLPQVFNALELTDAVLQPLSSAAPTLAVLGNHDIWLSRYSVLRMLRRAGITALNNAVFSLKQGGKTFHVAGVDDVMKDRARLDVTQSKLPDDGCTILLAHEPDFADTSAATGRFDLQLSGHSHGGQVVLPLFGPPILPYMGHKYWSGLYRVMDMYQYTNRGVGMTAPNVRFNCRPEITVFTLESA